MIYLIHYDRQQGLLVSMRSFLPCDRNDASLAKLDLEIALLGADGINEVVLLEAPSEEHLRKTHRRYFETLENLKTQEKKP